MVKVIGLPDFSIEEDEISSKKKYE